MADVSAMVREFMEKFGQPIGERPELPDRESGDFRFDLLHEEVKEYAYAEELHEIADALADIVYVAYGTAWTHGFNLDEIIAEVHRSNMTKTPAGPMQKPTKGPDYQPPCIAEILGGKE